MSTINPKIAVSEFLSLDMMILFRSYHCFRSEVRQTKRRPAASSMKWKLPASARRQIVNSLTPAVRAASSTVAISTSALHLSHHATRLSPRLLRIKVRSVSTVNFTMRFSFFTRSPQPSVTSWKTLR